MLAEGICTAWEEFLAYIEKRCTPVEFQNWFAQVELVEETKTSLTVKVPNIFVQEYLLDNYRKELLLFLPHDDKGFPNLRFIIADDVKAPFAPQTEAEEKQAGETSDTFTPKLNYNYTFEHFIEGPSNQFVKSAAMGVAIRPGKSYNPLFIHGGVGLGKTHLLHSIGHFIKSNNKKLRVQCITTEEFINNLVYHLKQKKVDEMKRFYRNLDVLLIDDIQFLQNRLNFEDEICSTFEALINQSRQIVITSDKQQLKTKD